MLLALKAQLILFALALILLFGHSTEQREGRMENTTLSRDIWFNIAQLIHPVQLFHDDPVLFTQFCVFDEGVNRKRITKDEFKVFDFLMKASPDHRDWYFETERFKILRDYSEWDDAQNKHVIKCNFMSLIHPLQLLFYASNDYALFRNNIQAKQRFFGDSSDASIPTAGIKLLDCVKNVLYTTKSTSANRIAITPGSKLCSFVKMNKMFVCKEWNSKLNKHTIDVSRFIMNDIAVEGRYGYAICEDEATLDAVKLSVLPDAIPSLRLMRIQQRDSRALEFESMVIDLSQMQNHPNIRDIEIDGDYIVKIEHLPPNLIKLQIRSGGIAFVGTMSHVKKFEDHPQFGQLSVCTVRPI